MLIAIPTGPSTNVRTLTGLVSLASVGMQRLKEIAMKTTYQHRFCFVYVDRFTIEDHGLCFKNKFYPWNTFKHFSTSKGYTFLEFDNKKIIFLNQHFRIKDSPVSYDRYGRNKAYRDFEFLVRSIERENKLDPEYKNLRDLSDKLINKIDKTVDESEFSELLEDYTSCSSKMNVYQEIESNKKSKKIRRLKFLLLFFILVLNFIIIFIFNN